MSRLKKYIRAVLGVLLECPKGRRALAGASAAIFFLVAQPAFASAPVDLSSLHINWWTWDTHAPPIGWFLIDFAIFVWILVKMGKKQAGAAFKARHERIKTDISTAEEGENKARSYSYEYVQKLERADEERRLLIDGSEEDGIRDREHAIVEAKEYAERLIKDGAGVAALEERRAYARLKKTAVSMAIAGAREEIAESINGEDRQRLFDDALLEIEGGAK